MASQPDNGLEATTPIRHASHKTGQSQRLPCMWGTLVDPGLKESDVSILLRCPVWQPCVSGRRQAVGTGLTLSQTSNLRQAEAALEAEALLAAEQAAEPAAIVLFDPKP